MKKMYVEERVIQLTPYLQENHKWINYTGVCHCPLLMAKFLTIRYLILGGATHLFGIIMFNYRSD